MIRLIVTVMVLMLVPTGEGWSSQPTVEPLFDVEDPSHYHEIVSTSAIPGLLASCTLADPGKPKYMKGKPERIFFRQVYLTSASHSEFGVRYRLQVKVEVNHDTISGLGQLEKLWADYKKNIAIYENHPAVRRFLKIMEPNEMNFNGAQFYGDKFSENQISFHLDSASFYFLFFRKPELIQSVAQFIPSLDSMNWFQEFRDEVGIGSVQLKNGKVTISQDQRCPTCLNHVTFLESNSRLVSFALSANQSWKEFPMVSFAREVVQARLEGDSLGSCTIGSGNSHAYLMLSHNVIWRERIEDIWRVRVALQCQPRIHWRDVCFRILPDSTIDRFRVCYDNRSGRR